MPKLFERLVGQAKRDQHVNVTPAPCLDATGNSRERERETDTGGFLLSDLILSYSED